ncbi:protein FAM114A2 [Hetaerina americana]|uniref:protein FAM114A2 n=1 Tax=Hetaerina americana TaxID=62018 RepID=UPI003A7F2543
MTTSDSEDFESADEDIEPDNPELKSTVEIKGGPPNSDVIKKGSDLEETCSVVSSKSVTENVVYTTRHSSQPGNSDELSANLEVKCVVKDDALTSDTNNSYSEGIIDGKSGMQSRSDDKVQEPVKQASEKSLDRGRPQRTKEGKSGPMKLGVKLSSQHPPVQGEKAPLETLEAFPLHPGKVNTEESIKSDGVFKSQVETKLSSLLTTDDSAKTEVEQQPSLQSSSWGFGKGLMGAGGLGSLGGWGSSLLNTATLSVSTLGSHVTQGINTVLETVEAGIGAPSPEELARKIKEEKEKTQQCEVLGGQQAALNREDEDDNAGELEMEAWGDWNDDDDRGGTNDDDAKGGTGLLSLVTGMTQVTGKVFSTGLDTLEVIGKKTMEVLQEGDPGLKKKRALLLGERDTVVLSQVLREAKEKAEEEAKLAEEKEAARKAHFETLFDDYQGLVHLEALEMLSRQSDLRLKSLLLKETGPALRGLQIRLAAVQEMCEIPDSDENEDAPALTETISESLNALSVEVSAEKLIQCVKESHDHLADMKADVGDDGMSKAVPKIIHQEAITALATITANAIEVFHKVTELLLVKEGKSRKVKDESKALVCVTSSLVSEVNKIATEFSDFLSTKLNDDSLMAADREKIESYITSTFLEASNSSTYIQDAFQLMVPVLQIGVIV